jgi:hypothetical protein
MTPTTEFVSRSYLPLMSEHLLCICYILTAAMRPSSATWYHICSSECKHAAPNSKTKIGRLPTLIYLQSRHLSESGDGQTGPGVTKYASVFEESVLSSQQLVTPLRESRSGSVVAWPWDGCVALCQQRPLGSPALTRKDATTAVARDAGIGGR